MAVAFELPEAAREVYQTVGAMPDDQFTRLARFVADLPQDRLLTETVDRLQKRLPPADREAFLDIITELSRLARTIEYKRSGSSDEVVRRVVEQTVGDSDSAAKLTERLETLVAERAVQLHARAMSLLYDEERTLSGARLVTDIRPIFNDSGDSADNFIVVNHLRIRYQENFTSRTISIALDEDDIEALASLAKRAKRKTEFLKRLVLEPRFNEKE